MERKNSGYYIRQNIKQGNKVFKMMFEMKMDVIDDAEMVHRGSRNAGHKLEELSMIFGLR